MRTPSQLVTEVCARVGVDPADVRDSKIRGGSVSRVRRGVAYVLRVERGCTWGEVARAIGTNRSSAKKLCSYTNGETPDDIVQIVRDAG